MGRATQALRTCRERGGRAKGLCTHLQDELLQQPGVLGVVLGHVGDLGPGVLEHLLEELLALLEQLQPRLVVLVRDGAANGGGEVSAAANKAWTPHSLLVCDMKRAGDGEEDAPTYIFFSISACFFLRSKLASMLALSCRTILPCRQARRRSVSWRRSSTARTGQPAPRLASGGGPDDEGDGGRCDERDGAHLLDGKLLVGLDLDLARLLERLLLDEGRLRTWQGRAGATRQHPRPKYSCSPSSSPERGGATGRRYVRVEEERGTHHLAHLADDFIIGKSGHL